MSLLSNLFLLAAIGAVAVSPVYAVDPAGAASAVASAALTNRSLVPNRAPLAQTPFVPLPIGSVRAEGWLLRQLELQKAGLTGSAEQLYDALTADSGWLGGKGEGWEKGPYYVKGLIALAYTLDDAELKQRSQKWIDWALGSQTADGFFGPASNNDWWPRMVVLFYLRDYYEATGDARVIPFLTKYFHHQLTALPGRPLQDWGRSRAGDNIDIVLWTYNHTGDAAMLDLAKLLYTQAYPWKSIFTDNRFYAFGEDFQPHHIVNVSQALKFPAVAWQFTHDDADLKAYTAGVKNLDTHYGRIDGQVSGTEMLSGLASTDGVELCADIERIISDGIAVTVTGDAAVGDRLEKVAYNSLPAHTSPKMQQITYYQLPNQVAATHGGHGFTQDYGNGNVPGPHSGFPCCCYNWHAGWPKFVQQMWAATADGGLAAIAYGPNQVTTTVADGVPITIKQDTDYPFAESIVLKIDPQRPAHFALALRIPGWCKNPAITVNGKDATKVKSGSIQPDSFFRVAREWKAGDVVTIDFPMAVRASTWVHGSAGIERGPLAFALKINEDWKKSHDFLKDFDEYEVLPKSAWNYALMLERGAGNSTGNTTADGGRGNGPGEGVGSRPGGVGDRVLNANILTRPVPAIPFSTEAPPIVLTLPARKLPAWGYRTLPGTVTLGRADGAWHPIGEEKAAMIAGKPTHVRIVTKGPSIRVFINDMTKPALEREDATIAAGGIGLRTYGAAASFDNILLDGQPVADFNGTATGPKTGADIHGTTNWQVFGGHWGIKNGAYTAEPAKDGKAILKSHDDLHDFTLDATVTVQPGGDAGIMFRVTQPTPAPDGYHGYYLGLTPRPAQSEDAEEPPVSPVTSDQPVEQVELIPFGSAKLRVSYFPVLGR